jgi:hypothetical protein
MFVLPLSGKYIADDYATGFETRTLGAGLGIGDESYCVPDTVPVASTPFAVAVTYMCMTTTEEVAHHCSTYRGYSDQKFGMSIKFFNGYFL